MLMCRSPSSPPPNSHWRYWHLVAAECVWQARPGNVRKWKWTSAICCSECVNTVPRRSSLAWCWRGQSTAERLLVRLPTPTDGRVPSASWFLEGGCSEMNGDTLVDLKLQVEFNGLVIIFVLKNEQTQSHLQDETSDLYSKTVTVIIDVWFSLIAI